jgi:methionine--tRNA ligase beta chain
MKKDIISIGDFAKADIRVGLVKEAKPVANSKKLIQLIVDMGTDYGEVTILTGLLQYYPDPSILAGKKYLFLANLAPRAMAGVESQGMFLAVDGSNRPLPLNVFDDDAPIGAYVH